MTRNDLPRNGTERYSNECVTFHRPFTLGKAPEIYPAGVYHVETKRLPAEAAGHTTWVRSSTVLVIPTHSGSYCREVRGADLDEAILRNSSFGQPGEPSENPDLGVARTDRP